MASHSKKVLVTGIDGFTGLYLEPLLEAAGYDVHGLVYPASRKANHRVCNIADKQDITAAISAIRPDAVIHLAAISFVPHSNVRQIYDINLLGTLNLLDALVETGQRPAKVVLASSANVYGNPPVPVIDETVCPSPVNHYANSKLAMEHLARTYADRLDIVITRPFNYTGVGQPALFLIPKIVSHYREGKRTIELGNLDVSRDFSDVRFVADVYKTLMECPAATDVVNICSGTGISLLQVIEKMNALAGYEIKVAVNPAFVRANEVKVLIGSNKRLQSYIGVRRTYTFDETLQWMFAAAGPR